jgi:hypothetical protein
MALTVDGMHVDARRRDRSLSLDDTLWLPAGLAVDRTALADGSERRSDDSARDAERTAGH